jgi:trans-2-enoyl-CoA reductase
MKDELLMENALEQFQHLARQKFMAGIVEHNLDGTKGLDRMTALQLVDSLKQEVMDMWFYAYVVEQKLLNFKEDE